MLCADDVRAGRFGAGVAIVVTNALVGIATVVLALPLG